MIESYKLERLEHRIRLIETQDNRSELRGHLQKLVLARELEIPNEPIVERVYNGAIDFYQRELYRIGQGK